MRRALRVLCWALMPFVVYFAVALLGAFVQQNTRSDLADAEPTREIILVAGLIHYDILLPADDVTIAMFDFVEDAGVPLGNPQVRWLAIGWGSEAFYTTAGTYADLTFGAVWTAATGDAGVMRFEVTGALPDHPKLRRVPVTQDQLDALRGSILADLGAPPRALGLAGFSDTDAFFEAEGRFHGLRTCNVWVAHKLADAGLAMGVWTPTPYALTLSLWWNGHLERPS